ncbi:MAG: hypothetical protein A2Y65_08055 [Deltaproteobacteria bacterium RBG_13_52_11]|nr:MAG: hypothetical protein A2Y65_08055 [Deltaproteobacteria bacterium RBG_13_52_11]
MKEEQAASYGVVLFQSISGALRAEKLLKKQGIDHKLIPVPRHLSSDCGVCLRFLNQNESQIRKTLSGKVEIQSICPL